jgi:hypothetical protein
MASLPSGAGLPSVESINAARVEVAQKEGYTWTVAEDEVRSHPTKPLVALGLFQHTLLRTDISCNLTAYLLPTDHSEVSFA